MSVLLTYGPGTYHLGRLSDEIVAGGVTLLTIRGDTTNIEVEAADGTVSATVDAIVAAHSGTPTPVYPTLVAGSTKWLRGDGTLQVGSIPAALPLSVAEGGTGSALGFRLLTTMEPSHAQRVFTPDLSPSTPFLLVATDAYFCYLGRTAVACTPKYVEFLVTSAGVGIQTAEVGLFSSGTAPNKAGQSLSKLVADGTVDTLGTTGVKRNTSAMSTSIAAGTHVWAGLRVSMTISQPTLLGVANDLAQGQILTTVGATALTGSGPFTGAIIAAALAVGANCPYLTATLD